jgi:hypothetical protein
MSDEIQNNLTTSDMLRMTTENTTKFLMQLANHIDTLEATIVELNAKIADLESKNEA